MHRARGVAALLAFAARLVQGGRLHPFAEHQLAQPECEALLADALPTLEQQARGQAPFQPGLGEPSAQRMVTDEGAKSHAPI